jgi:MATE family multidrug resistance protein
MKQDSTPLARRLVRLAVPNAVSGLAIPLAGLVDVAMLGHLGEIRHLAGVGLASVLFDYLYWSFGFLKMSTRGLTAQAVGARSESDAGVILARAVVAASVVGVSLFAAGPILERAGFALLAGSGETESAGRAYFNARLWGAPAALVNFAAIGWLLGRERAVPVLAMTAVAAGTNIVLDIQFIYVLELGSYGAGLASALSQYAMLVVAIAIIAREKPDLSQLAQRFADRKDLSALFVLNRDIMVRTFCLITAFATFTNISATLGTALLATNTILLKLLETAAYFIDGLAFATQSLAGIYRGADDRSSLWILLRMSLTWGLLLAAIAAFSILTFPHLIFPAMTSHAGISSAAAALAPWLCATIAMGSVAYILDGYFIGLTEGRILRNGMLISVLMFLPPALWAARTGSNTLLWAAMLTFMVARSVSLGIRVAETLRAPNSPKPSAGPADKCAVVV